MLNPEAKIPRARLLLGEGERIERHARTAVADSVKAKLKPSAGALRGFVVQGFLLVAGNASVFRIVIVGRKHGGCARAERSVHESLEHSGMQHRIPGRMMGAPGL